MKTLSQLYKEREGEFLKLYPEFKYGDSRDLKSIKSHITTTLIAILENEIVRLKEKKDKIGETTLGYATLKEAREYGCSQTLQDQIQYYQEQIEEIKNNK